MRGRKESRSKLQTTSQDNSGTEAISTHTHWHMSNMYEHPASYASVIMALTHAHEAFSVFQNEYVHSRFYHRKPFCSECFTSHESQRTLKLGCYIDTSSYRQYPQNTKSGEGGGRACK